MLLKHNNTLLFNPVKIARTFFSTNIGLNITKRIPKGKNPLVAYLKNTISKSLYFQSLLIKLLKILNVFLTTNHPAIIAYQHL